MDEKLLKMEIDGLAERIKSGELSPQEALDKISSPFKHVSAISLKELTITPLPCGFPTLDRHRVFKRGRPELLVVGGASSHGKSSFMMQAAAFIAKSQPVHVVSLEMDERDIMTRLLSLYSGIDMGHIQDGWADKGHLAAAKAEIDKLNLRLWCKGTMGMKYIKDRILDLSKEVPPGLIVLDYVQEIRGAQHQGRTGEIRDVLEGMLDIARIVRCPVLTGSQLNTKMIERRGKQAESDTGFPDYKPLKSDLFDSSNIEHCADVVILISRPYVHDRETRPDEADVIVAKNRNGSLGDFVFRWDGRTCSFVDNG